HDVREKLEAAARGEPLDEGELRRVVARIGRLRVSTIFRLLAARCAAQARQSNGRAGSRGGRSPIHSLYREALRIAFREGGPLEMAGLAVDGADLGKAGVPPGPQIGRTLARLLEDVLDDPRLNTREALLARVAELGATTGSEGKR